MNSFRIGARSETLVAVVASTNNSGERVSWLRISGVNGVEHLFTFIDSLNDDPVMTILDVDDKDILSASGLVLSNNLRGVIEETLEVEAESGDGVPGEEVAVGETTVGLKPVVRNIRIWPFAVDSDAVSSKHGSD